ncbi:MAG: transposase [Gemmatimonadota bacterium]
MAAQNAAMPRAKRPHAPGQGVHITARVQGRAHLFTEPIRHEIAAILCEAAAFAGSDVLALAIMTNHFHMVIKQGLFPLGWMMQRAMQQTALLVKRTHGMLDHVFGGRYWSRVCSGPVYLRQAIIYAHLNPWKAGLCTEPELYAWSSQSAFNRTPTAWDWTQRLAVDQSRLLFARESFDDTDITANYKAYMQYWKLRYLMAVPGDRLLFEPPDEPDRPCSPKGDEYWGSEYSHAHPDDKRVVERHDICERAVDILRSLDPDCSLDILRLAGRSRAITRVRRELIAALRSLGYPTRAISRCLFVSPALVSDVGRSIRRAPPPR